jgi:hypothetical protein
MIKNLTPMMFLVPLQKLFSPLIHSFQGITSIESINLLLSLFPIHFGLPDRLPIKSNTIDLHE